MKKLQYPECERLARASKNSNTIGAFLDWLGYEKHLTLCAQHDHTDDCRNSHGIRTCGFLQDGYAPAYNNKEKLLAEYFKIDLDKVEEERRAMLKALQEGNKP